MPGDMVQNATMCNMWSNSVNVTDKGKPEKSMIYKGKIFAVAPMIDWTDRLKK